MNHIFSEIDSLAPDLTALRRDLHRHPELGWQEIRTSCRIAVLLKDLGYEVLVGRDVCEADSRMGLPSREALDAAYDRAVAEGADPALAAQMRGGFTGVVGILRKGDGPTVALRFDMDALPLDEGTGLPFSSIHKNTMHACGHDGHVTIGLGAARILPALPFHGTVKLLFQPAEEGVRGAKSMVDKGHLDGVDYVLAAHMGDGNRCISIGTGASLATTKLDAVFRGSPAHAGFAPQDGQNAMLAAATAVLNLHAMPRHGDADTRVNVGTIHGGTGRNIICPQVKLELEVRAGTSEANHFLTDYAKGILESAAAMHGCTAEITSMGAAESARNSTALADRLARACREAGLPVEVLTEDGPLGSEDFSYMAKHVREQGGQSLYFYVRSHCAAGLHQREFDFEEAGLTMGVKGFVTMVTALLP